jgi:hypothetical protein
MVAAQSGLTPHCSGLATRAAEFDIVRSHAQGRHDNVCGGLPTHSQLHAGVRLPVMIAKRLGLRPRPPVPVTVCYLAHTSHRSKRQCTTLAHAPVTQSPVRPCVHPTPRERLASCRSVLCPRMRPPHRTFSHRSKPSAAITHERETVCSLRSGARPEVSTFWHSSLPRVGSPRIGAPVRPNPSLQRTRYASR